MAKRITIVEGEDQDILYMLEDCIASAENRLEQFQDWEIEEDDGLQEELANLAVAIRLHDKISGNNV